MLLQTGGPEKVRNLPAAKSTPSTRILSRSDAGIPGNHAPIIDILCSGSVYGPSHGWPPMKTSRTRDTPTRIIDCDPWVP